MAAGERADDEDDRVEREPPELELTPFGEPGERVVHPPAGASDSLRPRSSSAKRQARSRVFPGAEWLGSDDPRQVLRGLSDGDPLGIAERCRRRLARRAILLDAQTLEPRALARVAHRAREYDGEPGLDAWLDGCIDRAIEDLLVEASERESRSPPELDPTDPTHRLFAELLGIEAPLARRSALAFNRLPPRPRRVVWELVVEGKTLGRASAEGLGEREVLMEELASALRRLDVR